MARITQPFIIKETENQPKYFTEKKTNMEKLVQMDDLHEMTIYELRIIMMIMIQKGRKVKTDNPEENQIFEISKAKFPKLFTNSKGFYDAIEKFVSTGFLRKIEGKQSLYYVDPAVINNLTNDQAFALGISNYKPKK